MIEAAGGGIYARLSSIEITNTSFYNNYSESGSALQFAEGSYDIDKISLFDNSSDDDFGGIRSDSADVNIQNSILRNNNGEIKIYSSDTSGELTIGYSNVQGGLDEIVYSDSEKVFWQSGNIDADPLFVNAAEYDLRLYSRSPCIDTGDPASPPEADSSRTDMGVFYFPEIFDFTADEILGYDSLLVNFSENSCGFTSSSIWKWDFQNDGSIDSNDQNPENIFYTGIYDVSLTIEKGVWADTLIRENYIIVADSSVGSPENIRILTTDDDISLEWDELPEIDYYLIYHSNNVVTDYELLNYTEALSYIHDNALTSYERRFYFIIGFIGNRSELLDFIANNRMIDLPAKQ